MGSRAPGQKCTRWGGQCADEGQSARWGAECPMGSSTPGQNCTRWEAECDKGLRARTEVHPMGSRAPDGEQYTWTERVQCTPIGCRALANKHKRGALPLAGTRGAVAAGWTVCGACGAMRAWASTRTAVRVDVMAAPPRPPPRRVDRGACWGRRRAWAIDVDLGAACASVGGHARVAAGMGAGRLGRLGSLDGGLSAVDGDVAVDDDARFRREEAGHRRLAL